MRNRPFRIYAALLGLAVCTSFAGAQTTAPTTEPMAAAPTSQPAVAIDASTPRGALKSLVGAMQAGDTAKIKGLIATTTPTEGKMVDAMASMSASENKFRTAAKTAFGDNAKELTGDTEAGTAAGMAKIDGAKETITGDKATVEGAGPPDAPPLNLTKVDGNWRIPISELARGVDESTINQRLDDLTFMSKMMDESADELSAGKYKTPKEAGDAIKSKMMVAMMKRSVAATQATTGPGAAPAPAPDAAEPPAPSTQR